MSNSFQDNLPSDSFPRIRDSLTMDFASNTELIDKLVAGIDGPDIDHTRTTRDHVIITKMENATADNALNKSGPTAKEKDKYTTYASNSSAAIPIDRASRDFGGFAMDTQENTLYSQLLKDGDTKRLSGGSQLSYKDILVALPHPAAQDRIIKKYYGIPEDLGAPESTNACVSAIGTPATAPRVDQKGRVEFAHLSAARRDPSFLHRKHLSIEESRILDLQEIAQTEDWSGDDRGAPVAEERLKDEVKQKRNSGSSSVRSEVRIGFTPTKPRRPSIYAIAAQKELKAVYVDLQARGSIEIKIGEDGKKIMQAVDKRKRYSFTSASGQDTIDVVSNRALGPPKYGGDLSHLTLTEVDYVDAPSVDLLPEPLDNSLPSAFRSAIPSTPTIGFKQTLRTFSMRKAPKITKSTTRSAKSVPNSGLLGRSFSMLTKHNLGSKFYCNVPVDAQHDTPLSKTSLLRSTTRRMFSGFSRIKRPQKSEVGQPFDCPSGPFTMSASGLIDGELKLLEFEMKMLELRLPNMVAIAEKESHNAGVVQSQLMEQLYKCFDAEKRVANSIQELENDALHNFHLHGDDAKAKKVLGNDMIKEATKLQRGFLAKAAKVKKDITSEAENRKVLSAKIRWVAYDVDREMQKFKEKTDEQRRGRKMRRDQFKRLRAVEAKCFTLRGDLDARIKVLKEHAGELEWAKPSDGTKRRSCVTWADDGAADAEPPA